MTIMERALDRAKREVQMRSRDAVEVVPPALVAPDDTGTLEVVREREEAARPKEKFAELARVDIDAAACERNRVLFDDVPDTSAARRAAAAYRMLRSRAQHRINSGDWHRIGITSAGPGEGKTLTSINVALSIARERQRLVYLLDLDMRSPSILEYLGVQPPRQLSEFFTGGFGPDQVLYATNFDNLIVAGNRDPVPTASELLAGPRLEELLSHVRRRSPDAVILNDLPPVMSTDEALVVAPRLDGIFMVVSEGVTRRDLLVRSLDLLSDFPVAGIILNRSSEEFGRDYYNY